MPGKSAPERSSEVSVVGGGVMGCSTLYYVAQMGVTNTLLLERDTLGSGSTGRSAAILRSHYSNEVTTRMAIEGHRVIPNSEDAIGEPGACAKTGYVVLASERQADSPLPKRRGVAVRQRAVRLRRAGVGQGEGRDEEDHHQPDADRHGLP